MHFPRFSATLLLLAILSVGASVHAQSGAKSGPPGYADAIDQALTELEAANYPESREEFQRAHAIYPNARTLRGLGMVEFELRNYTRSVQYLEAALTSKEKVLDAKLRAETQALLERAQRYIGTVVIELEPSSATLTVDGIAADVTQGSVRVDVGQHTLEAQAPGRATERRIVQVERGAHLDVKMSLADLSAVSTSRVAAQKAEPSVASSEPRSEVQPVYKKWWLWTTVAVVVVGGATAAAILLTRDERTTAASGTNTQGVTLHTLERF
jgi:hypothetical protein